MVRREEEVKRRGRDSEERRHRMELRQKSKVGHCTFLKVQQSL